MLVSGLLNSPSTFPGCLAPKALVLVATLSGGSTPQLCARGKEGEMGGSKRPVRELALRSTFSLHGGGVAIGSEV